jgi:hypothetical protein
MAHEQHTYLHTFLHLRYSLDTCHMYQHCCSNRYHINLRVSYWWCVGGLQQ